MLKDKINIYIYIYIYIYYEARFSINPILIKKKGQKSTQVYQSHEIGITL